MCISNIVVEIAVGELRNFIDKTHLEKFINDSEDVVFGVEIVEMLSAFFVDCIESKACGACGSELRDNVLANFVSLVANFIEH
jgi:hypothetical protein